MHCQQELCAAEKTSTCQGWAQAACRRQHELQPTFDLLVVSLWLAHEQRCRLPIERVCGVRVEQQLWQEHLKDVDEVCRGSSRRVEVSAEVEQPGGVDGSCVDMLVVAAGACCVCKDGWW